MGPDYQHKSTTLSIYQYEWKSASLDFPPMKKDIRLVLQCYSTYKPTMTRCLMSAVAHDRCLVVEPISEHPYLS